MRIAVTGAFGYSGRHITGHLLEAGHEVVTLTNSLDRPNPFGDKVAALPFHFDEPRKLRASLEGVHTLVNTYWIRFDQKRFERSRAVANTMVLFRAAREAGVRRIVHISITNPDIRSPLPYFRGKAELEADLMDLGVSYCILRPTALFGKEDVLVNNIAWSLRHLPAIGVFGSGDYKLQPIHVDDLAQTAARKAVAEGDEVVEAIGPETFTYRGLVAAIRLALGVKRPILSLPPLLGYWGTRVVGLVVGDLVISREEIRGLMENKLWVDAPPLGTTRLTDWLDQHKDTLGRRYARSRK